MITERQLHEIDVPCKNKLTGNEQTFVVTAYDFSQAKRLLEYELDFNWIIGWMCF